jgi:nitrilase
MSRIVNVAVVQDAAVAFDAAASIERASSLLDRVSGRGVDLVLFPEAFVSGFPSGTDWGGQATAVRANDGSDDYRRYFAGAMTVPGPHCSALGSLARSHDVNLVIGVIERIGMSLSCSILHFDRRGVLVLVRRKVMPTMAERTIWRQSDGSSLHVAELDVGRVASVICWENYMPLLRHSLYAQGVEIYCAPTADDLDTWTSTMTHIAIEGRCFVLSACQFSRRSDFPADYGWFPSADPDFIVSRGGSCIVDPFGAVLVGPVFNEPAILSASLDLDQIVRGKHTFDVAGHYARPDIFRLDVDRRPKATASFRDK